MRKTLPTNEFFFSFPETILFFLKEIFQVLPLQKQLKNFSATQAVARNCKTVRNNNLCLKICSSCNLQASLQMFYRVMNDKRQLAFTILKFV